MERPVEERKRRNRPLITASLLAAIILVLILLTLDFMGLNPNTTISTSETLPSETLSLEFTATSTSEPTVTLTVTSTPTVTSTLTPTVLPTLTPTLMPSATSMLSPTPYLPGAIEINLPQGFKIGKWYDNSIKCDTDPKHSTVKIYGVEIFKGIPPYKITFSESNVEISVGGTAFYNRVLLFISPIEVKKGKYIRATITFQLEGKVAKWIDDIFYYYLNDPDC